MDAAVVGDGSPGLHSSSSRLGVERGDVPTTLLCKKKTVLNDETGRIIGQQPNLRIKEKEIG